MKIEFENDSIIESINTKESYRSSGYFLVESDPIYQYFLCYTEYENEKGWEIIDEFWLMEYYYDKYYDVLDIVDYWGLGSILYSGKVGK